MGSAFQLTLIAFFAAASFALAQGPASTSELVACINEKLVNQGNVDISMAVEKCIPQGCKVTASMSTASAQPACTLGGTQLPRVFLNCPGSAPGLRFRPTFTLCPRDASRIEVGDDVAPIAPSPLVPMQMASIQIPVDQPMFHELIGYLNTPGNNLRCTRCHGGPAISVAANAPLLSSPFDPFTTQRRNLLPFVIYSTEPTRKALIAPASVQTLDQVCGRIQSALENNPFAFGVNAPLQPLCSVLAGYANSRSCGNGVPNARCSGVAGGGIFIQNGASSTVALEFSGQSVPDPQSPERFVFKANDVDGTLTAFNSGTQTNINAVALSALEQTDGAFTGAGQAWVNGVTRAIAVHISYDKASDVSRVAITSPDGVEFYAGGTAPGVRFTGIQ